jgi:two-component system, OmpR family, copper resistance phosphate regulon response regulator CusR
MVPSIGNSGSTLNTFSANHAAGNPMLDDAPGYLPTATEQFSVMVVEDDVPLSRFLSRELKLLNFGVSVHHDAESAVENLKTSAYDLVILDLNLPNMDGIGFLQHVRSLSNHHFPVLVLSARTGTEDVISALDHGADDCLSKPFSFRELQARIRSLLRRKPVPTAAPSQAGDQILQVGDLVLNKEERRVTRGARRITLTPREFAILEYLMINARKPVSRVDLMREVWNIAFDPTTNVVDVYMKYLRDKVDHEGEFKLIRTVRGVGYELSND